MTSKYWEASLERAAEKIASASAGERNAALNAESLSLARLVASGVGTVEEILIALLPAAVAAGLSETEARATIRSGLRAGLQQPRQNPARGEFENAPVARPNPRVAPKPEAPRYPPAAEVKALWDASRPLWSSKSPDLAPEGTVLAKAQRYCTDRGWAPKDLALLAIARSLPSPKDHQYTDWWPSGWARIWNLITPAFDHKGNMVSIHARAIGDAKPKTRWPRGFAAKGLLFASPRGLALLRGRPMMWPVVECYICEGLSDFLTMSIWACGRELAIRQGVVVFGGTAGGFGALAKIRWPEGIHFFIATDDDQAGRGYAKKIIESLPENAEIRIGNFKD